MCSAKQSTPVLSLVANRRIICNISAPRLVQTCFDMHPAIFTTMDSSYDSVTYQKKQRR